MKSDVFCSKDNFIKVFEDRLKKDYLTTITDSNIRQRYNVLGTLVKEAISDDWMKTNQILKNGTQKEVYYFSMEFLMGRLITNNLMNLGIRDIAEEAFNELGIDLNEVENFEPDPGLGNGGLGRLAACYLDSMASLKIPGFGNCIRYRYGLFRQKIKNGYQEERPDNWLSDGYVWEIRKEEESEDIPFFGYVDYKGGMEYIPGEFIRAVPYDVPIVGDRNGVITHLRMWNAEPSRKYPKSQSAFDYEEKLQRISGFLYPDDTTEDGKRLRLMQQYFFSSAGVKSVCRKHKQKYNTLHNLADKIVFHINDTHPTLIIPELMRILLDEEHMEWEEAWEITTHCTAYTNHTILAEALEKWSVSIMQPLLPRIYQLIEEINRRFCNDLLERYGYDSMDLIKRLSIVQNGLVRMAHLCVITSFSVNGVAKLHTEILKNIEMKEFYNLYPEKFINVTNGITHRRWLMHSNKELSQLLHDTIGSSWERHPLELEKFKAFRKNKEVQEKLLHIKHLKKQALAKRIFSEQGLVIDPNSIFDIQVKRLHEYKRQLLNALHIMYIYHMLKTSEPFKENYVPHTFIFGAKAAGAYYFAKKVIKLINTIAKKVNQDEETNLYLKVVFVENYNVSYAEIIMPACDLSEQISTASKEASGTGNMKFMMNGAITIGTEDGANVEIHELVEDDNIFIFGLNAQEVNQLTQDKTYLPKAIYDNNLDLQLVLNQLVNGFFEDVDKFEFKEIYEKLVYEDTYFILKDFEAYKLSHARANEAYKDRFAWSEKMVVNIAKSGIFSSDRSILEYADKIWHVKAMK
ncbi:MAG: glycogen/starch/alpha-glucan phosphorylase [Firmicutes bacterium]|nr:glycogen/starch/alpha-glucan phosphorylase [Bacillota bacterium]